MIVRVNVVPNRNVVVDSDCAVVIFRVKVSCITSVDGIKLWLLTWDQFNKTFASIIFNLAPSRYR